MDTGDIKKGNDEWLTSIIKTIATNTSMILIKDNVLINPSEIASLGFVGHFKEDSKNGGAVDLTIHLRGGGRLEITGLGRERIDALSKAYIESVNPKNLPQATKLLHTR
jgi:hypothetical protein